MSRHASYANGFAPRDGAPLYPSLWNGCVGAWAPCLGVSGTVLRDWSGYSQHGTLTSMEADDWIASHGRYSMALASDDYVDCGGRSRLWNTGEMSVSCWFRTSSSGGSQMMVCPAEASSATPGGLSFGYLNAGKPVWWNNASGLEVVAAGKTCNDNYWHNATVVRSGAAGAWTISMYIDGALSNTASVSQNPAANSTAFTFAIGRFGAFASYYYSGEIDDVRIYNRPITSIEAKMLGTRRGVSYELNPRRLTKSSTINRRRRSLLRVT